MATGRREGYRDVLLLLGRAAGLSSLALATLASGPCGPCTTSDDCATVDELLATREKGIADAGPTSSAGSSNGGESAAAMNVATAKEWDGMACPTPEQYRSIVELKLPDHYSGASLTVTNLVSGKCCYHSVGADCG